MLFPEIDGLGAYLTGNNTDRGTAKNIVAYFRDVMSRIDSRYEEYAVFITFIFRHGLLHQHDPKKFKCGKREFGWIFSVNSGNFPESISRKNHLIWHGDTLCIDMNLFYEDVRNSVEEFIRMVEEGKVNFNGIQSVYYAQHRKLLKKNILEKGKKFVSKKDFQFLKK